MPDKKNIIADRPKDQGDYLDGKLPTYKDADGNRVNVNGTKLDDMDPDERAKYG